MRGNEVGIGALNIPDALPVLMAGFAAGEREFGLYIPLTCVLEIYLRVCL